MKAYELADELEQAPYYTSFEREAAVMLRQQADRIAALEKEVKRLIGAEPITYGMLTFCKNCGQQDPYSPQTKPLSEEEVSSIAWQLCECLGVSTLSADINVFKLHQIIKERFK